MCITTTHHSKGSTMPKSFVKIIYYYKNQLHSSWLYDEIKRSIVKNLKIHSVIKKMINIFSYGHQIFHIKNWGESVLPYNQEDLMLDESMGSTDYHTIMNN